VPLRASPGTGRGPVLGSRWSSIDLPMAGRTLSRALPGQLIDAAL